MKSFNTDNIHHLLKEAPFNFNRGFSYDVIIPPGAMLKCMHLRSRPHSTRLLDECVKTSYTTGRTVRCVQYTTA